MGCPLIGQFGKPCADNQWVAKYRCLVGSAKSPPHRGTASGGSCSEPLFYRLQVISEGSFFLGVGLPGHHISSALPAHPCCAQFVAQGGSADGHAVLLSDVLAERSSVPRPLAALQVLPVIRHDLGGGGFVAPDGRAQGARPDHLAHRVGSSGRPGLLLGLLGMSFALNLALKS